MLNRVLPPGLRRLVLYGICGGSGVALDFITFSTLVYIGVYYQAANAIGYASGTGLSFILNRRYTFDVRDAPWRRFVLFASVAFVGYCLSSAVLWLLVSHLRLPPIPAKVITLALVLIVQFGLNTTVTFRCRLATRPSETRQYS